MQNWCFLSSIALATFFAATAATAETERDEGAAGKSAEVSRGSRPEVGAGALLRRAALPGFTAQMGVPVSDPFSVRGAFVYTPEREATLAGGTVSWFRVGVAAGPELRLSLSDCCSVDSSIHVLLAHLAVSGDSRTWDGRRDFGIDWGIGLDSRLAWRSTGYPLWVGPSVAIWPANDAVVQGSRASQELGDARMFGGLDLEVVLALGVSFPLRGGGVR